MEHISIGSLARYIETGEISQAGEVHLSKCDYCLELVSIILTDSDEQPPHMILNRAKAAVPSRRSYALPIIATVAASLVISFLALILILPKGQDVKNGNGNSAGRTPSPTDRKAPTDRSEVRPDLFAFSKARDELVASYRKSNPTPSSGAHSFAAGPSKPSVTAKLAQIESKLGFRAIIPKAMPSEFTLSDVIEKEGRIALLYMKEGGICLIFQEQTRQDDAKPVSDSLEKCVYFVKSGILVVVMSKGLELQELLKVTEQFYR